MAIAGLASQFSQFKSSSFGLVKQSKKPWILFLILLVGIPYLISLVYKPPQIQVCMALYDYHSSEVSDLTFKKGDLIACLGVNGDWARGRLEDGRVGNFPVNYVTFELKKQT